MPLTHSQEEYLFTHHGVTITQRRDQMCATLLDEHGELDVELYARSAEAVADKAWRHITAMRLLGEQELTIRQLREQVQESNPQSGQDAPTEENRETEPEATEGARTLAAEKGIDLRDVQASGQRITKHDVQSHLSQE